MLLNIRRIHNFAKTEAIGFFGFDNGPKVRPKIGAGTIRNVFAPIRIGATTQSQRFDGIIDDVFVSTASDARDQIIAQSCLARPSTMTITPLTSGVAATPPENVFTDRVNNLPARFYRILMEP